MPVGDCVSDLRDPSLQPEMHNLTQLVIDTKDEGSHSFLVMAVLGPPSAFPLEIVDERRSKPGAARLVFFVVGVDRRTCSNVAFCAIAD